MQYPEEIATALHHRHIAKMPPLMQECLGNCLSCFEACTELISHCLSLGQEHAEPAHITVLQACALICETSAKMMMLGSDRHREVCKLCADFCEDCAANCEHISREDEMMSACAETCRRCADSCRRMVETC